jgi:hypothetical protein
MIRTFASLLAGTALATAAPALAQHDEHAGMDHGGMNMPGMDHGSMDHGQAEPDAAPVEESGAVYGVPLSSGNSNIANWTAPHWCCFLYDEAGNEVGSVDGVAFAAFAEGSGTARLPGLEASHRHGNIYSGDDWTAMAHGYVSTQYTDHGGPRGDGMPYVTSMLMLMAEREAGWGRLQFKSMMSLEPLMSARGYPNLFASGETANGAALIDRQHPHDLFMELTARADFNLGPNAGLFLYGGPVGEPAIGPSAFMHRGSAANNPEPPITHHWFDSTHITYGVATAGIATRRFQLEASAFRGAEPDEHRWDIETPRLDSWSVRATLNPSPNWSLQASYGEIKEPEALHPGEDEHRFTASAQYSDGALSAMAAFSAKSRVPGDTLTAWLGEANWDFSARDSLFGRVENVRNDELFPDHLHPLHDRAFRVTKFQAGYARHIPLGDALKLTLGGSASAYAKPDALDPYYGNSPLGYTLFARISLGH